MAFIFNYKIRQEQYLMDLLVNSGFITKDILLEINSFYNVNPYHNFVHALKVARSVLDLSSDDFNLLEIKSLFYAALFHDAGHTGQAKLLDEYNSLDIAFEKLEAIEKKHNIWLLDYTIVRNAIMWTVFSQRGNRKNRYSIVLWDLDIWVIWEDIYHFLYYSLLLCQEMKVPIKKWLQESQRDYFKFLMTIDKNVLISEEVRKIYPNSLSVIKRFFELDNKLKIDIYNTLLKDDITLEEFYEKYQSKFPKGKLKNKQPEEDILILVDEKKEKIRVRK